MGNEMNINEIRPDPETAGVEFNKKEIEYIRQSLLKATTLDQPREANTAYAKICRIQEIAIEEGWTNADE